MTGVTGVDVKAAEAVAEAVGGDVDSRGEGAKRGAFGAPIMCVGFPKRGDCPPPIAPYGAKPNVPMAGLKKSEKFEGPPDIPC